MFVGIFFMIKCWKGRWKKMLNPWPLKHKIKSVEQNSLVAKSIVYWILQCIKNAFFVEYCVYACIHFNIDTNIYVNMYNESIYTAEIFKVT